jgi:hypothetical protein
MIAIKHVGLQSCGGSKTFDVYNQQQQLRPAIEGCKPNVSAARKEHPSPTLAKQNVQRRNSHPNSDVDPPDFSIIVRNRMTILNQALA